MNKDNYKSIVWSMFSLSFTAVDTFTWNYEIDSIWLERQKMKLNASANPTLFVIADLFCELVYDISFSKQETDLFCDKLQQRLQIEDVTCIRESELIAQYYGTEQYLKDYSAQLANFVKSDELPAQIEKRKQMYNVKNLEIPEEKLKMYAKRAIVLFDLEKKLEEKILSRDKSEKN